MTKGRAGTPRVGPLLVHIDPGASGSLQAQIYAGIRRAIVDGILARGARLISSRALAVDLGVSRTTTLLAFDQLVAEGYLTTKYGSGTFVARDLPDEGPRPPASARGAKSPHPPLSRRGAAIAATPPIAARIAGPPRPFRIGTPALDLFPLHLWTRLTQRTLQATTVGQLDYGSPAGLRDLREAIADHVSRARGTSCVADQVIVVAGAQSGLELIFRLLIDPGDVACIEEPGYPGARAALMAAGARLRPIHVDAEGMSVPIGREAEGTRVIYVTPSHQFPLGVPMSLPRRLALLAWARRTGAWIIEDDYDSEFRYGMRPIPCLHGLDRGGRVIYVGTFSKTLFPALRLGFLIVPLDLRDAVIRSRRAVDLHPAGLPQVIVADLMIGGHYERHLRRMQGEYRARLDALAAGVARHCRGAVTLRPVTSGLHAVADLATADDAAVFREAAARGVEVMPVSAYCARARPAGSSHGLVLGFGSVRPELLCGATERLAAAVEAAERTPAARRNEPGSQ